MLKTDVKWPNSRRFKSRSEWEPVAFFSDALCNSSKFDLKLGFFSSTAINVLSNGFAVFLYNGGKMRLIVNEALSNSDRMVLLDADSGKEVPLFDLNDIAQLQQTLSNRDEHFFDCLVWLIRHDRLEFKIVSPKWSDGISHSKCGVFSDALNKVGFDGSCNFSGNALLSNLESITAFCDWDSSTDLYKIDDISDDFELTFSGKDETVDYLNASDIEAKLVNAFPSKDIEELLKNERDLIPNDLEIPYTARRSLDRVKDRIDSIIENLKKEETFVPTEPSAEPKFPFAEPRDYQKQAYENWKNNNQKGLFAMATGTGKTLTSLNCLLHIYDKYKYYKAIILVPTITLVGQWEKECKRFNFSNIVKICSKNTKWEEELNIIKSQENMSSMGVVPSYIIICTYSSFAKQKVFDKLVSFPKKANSQILLIADEAHNMGAGRISNRLEGIPFRRRIGLSATPERQFDDLGNSEIRKFFGAEEKYTFEYFMRAAIDNGFLCRYYYYPHVVKLTDEELAEYIEISKKLVKFFNFNNSSFPQAKDILKGLLLKRKRIIHKARNKKDVFRKIIEDRYAEKGNLKYTLVYVPEGCEPDDDHADIFDSAETLPVDADAEMLIDEYTNIVKNVSETTTVRKFVAESTERDVMLKEFAEGRLEVLTSMKCLDEGVDVPRSELAIFCASTGNPRQFIQRRGRILRTHPDKKFAVIHDLVVVPDIDIGIYRGNDYYEMEKKLLEKELKRVHAFADLSENLDKTLDELDEVLTYYKLSLFNNGN